MAHESSAKTVIERVEEALREVATLFVALAPLDVALGAERPHAFSYGLIFEADGVSLFVLSLFLERRRSGA